MTQTSQALQLAPGDQFEGHQIVDLIAKGGRTFVYKAFHADSDEHRALKISVSGKLSDEDSSKFRTAVGERLPSPKHTNLEQTSAGGVTKDGRTWFSAELLGGRSLEVQLSESGPLSAEEATPIAIQLARALEAIHACGFLHRNLKPSNVLILDDGTVKLLDVGLSICLPKEQPLSTPQMTSPEEISRTNLDTRADVYSLGALLFQLVTGKPPFSGSLEEVMHGHLHEPPPRLRALKPSAVALGDIVNRAMAKRPSNRYQTMAAMADALEEAGGQHFDPAPKAAPTAASTDEPSPRRRRLLIGIGAGAAVVGGVAFAVCRWKGLL